MSTVACPERCRRESAEGSNGPALSLPKGQVACGWEFRKAVGIPAGDGTPS